MRAQFYQVLFHWMKTIEVHHLKEYEADFIQFLLNGISDEALEISPKCIAYLEEHGNRMKDALIQLGDIEDDDTKMDELTNKGKKASDDDMTQDG